jgi:thiamine pyrophosphokinase
MQKAIKHAIENGFNSVSILGAFGGRLDHTFASIYTLPQLIKSSKFDQCEFELIDQYSMLKYFTPGKYEIKLSKRETG